MTGKEQRNVKILGLVLSLLFLYGVGFDLIAAPFRSVRRELESVREDKDRLEGDILAKKKYAEDYPEILAWMPSDDTSRSGAEVAVDYFHDRIATMLEKTGFSYGRIAEPRVSSYGKAYSKDRKKRLQTASFRVTGDGTLKSVMEFLLDLYQQGEWLYVSRLKINPHDKQHGKKVKATIILEALVVPCEKKLLALGDPTASCEDVGSGREEGVQTRLRGPVEAYSQLLAWAPFDPYKPSASHRKKPPRPTTRIEPVEIEEDLTTPEPQPKRTGWPDRDRLIVKGFMVDEVLVARQGTQRRAGRRAGSQEAGDRRYIKIGEDFDGGTLEWVHHLGPVVRKKGEGDDPGQLWFYPFGRKMSECKLLDEADDYPEVQWAMKSVGSRQEAVGSP